MYLMNTYFRAVLVTFAVLVTVQGCFAKDWRGITPLRSTRTDVVRLLKQCSEQIEACAFSLAQEDVYILFSGGLGEEDECATRLAPETVVLIHVWPKSEPRIADLHLDKKTLKRLHAPALLNPNHKGFLAREGLVIDTYRGRVLQAVYIAGPSDVRLCPVFQEKPALLIQTFFHHPPLSVSINCPAEAITPGTKLVLRSSVGLDLIRGPKWTVNAGRILAGQHTHRLTLDTTVLAGRTILVSAEIGDGPSGHAMSTSCQIAIAPN